MPVLTRAELHGRILDLTPAQLSALERQSSADYLDQLRTYQPESFGPSETIRIDPLPLVLEQEEFDHLGQSVALLGTLLERFLADLLGEQRLLAEAVAPPDILWGADGWEPSWHGLNSPNRPTLTFFSLDLTLDHSGWSPSSLYGAYPKGLGHTLLQRIALFRAIGNTINASNLLRLAPFLKEVKESIVGRIPSDTDLPRVAVWHDEHRKDVFEPLFLARYLGLPTVEARDLTVRTGGVHLKTLQGLRRLDVLWRWVEDRDLDPLGRVPSGTNGVAGLFDVIRQGRVEVLNGPGCGFLNRLVGSGLLPRLDQALLGDRSSFPIRLPSLDTAAPFFDGSGWREAPFTLRLFCVRFQDGWRLLPGGIAQATLPNVPEMVQKDLWVLAPRPTAQVSLLTPSLRAEELSRIPDFPSRLAEDLYWLGRYTERAWQACALARKRIEIAEDEGGSEAGAPEFLGRLSNQLAHLRGQAVSDTYATENLRVALGLLLDISRQVTDRLSSGMHRLLRDLRRLSRAEVPPHSGEHVLNAIDLHLSALNGYITENMTRTPGWYFLEMGRRLERLSDSLDVLSAHFSLEDAAERLGLLLDLFDSSITYRTRYRNLPELAPVLDLLVADESNPRSLAFQASLLQDHSRALPKTGPLGRLQTIDILLLKLGTALRTFDPLSHDRSSILQELTAWSDLVVSCANEFAARYFAQVKSATSIQSRTGRQEGP